MSVLGIGGKKKTVAYTSTATLWGDSTVPYSGSQAIFDYIMQSSPSTSIMGKTLPDYMIDAYNRSLPPKLKAIKRKLDVDPSYYHYGDIESSFRIQDEVGVTAYFQDYFDTLTGFTTTMQYQFLSEINNSHGAWDIFKRLYGYSTETNQLNALTTFIGKPVYLYDAQVKYCSDTIARIVDPVLLDGIGIGFNWGETQTRSRNLSVPVTAWVEDTGAVNDHVDMSYTFRVDRTRTKVENIFTSTVISDDTITDIPPPVTYDSLSTIDLSPTTSDVSITVKDAPDPLLAPPSSNTATIAVPSMSGLTTSATGGTLLANTYYSVVTAYTAAGHTVVSSEMSVTTTGSTSKISPTWGSVAGATGYRYWRGTTSGTYDGYYDVGLVTTFDDINVTLTSSSIPSSNTALIPTPTLSSITGSTTGGSLPADTYFVKITAITASGETDASTEQSVTTTGTTSSITVPIPTIAGATGFKIWRGTETNGQNVHYTVGVVSSFVDDGSIVTPTHSETVRTTIWLSHDDYICSVDNDFLFYEESGAIDDSDGLDDSSNILDPNISNTFVPSHDGSSSEYSQVRYTYNDGTEDQWGIFTYEYGSGGNLTLDGILSDGGLVGDFYPRIYCRNNGERLDTDALKGTDAYKSSMKLCKRLGMDWSSLSKSLHENIGALGDVKQIVVCASVAVNSAFGVEQEYLNKWFHKIFTLLDDVPYITYKERTIRNHLTGIPIPFVISETIPGARLGQTIVMKDTLYEQRLNFGAIRSQNITGSIGEIGATQHSVSDNDHTYLLQIDASTYREVVVYDLISYEYVSGGYRTQADGSNDNLIIPLDNSMFNSMSKRRREELYGRAMRVVINTTKVVKTKWYQTPVFQVVIFAAALVFAIATAGAGTPLSATLITFAVVTVTVMVVTQLVMMLLIKLGVDPSIAAVIATVVAIWAGGKVQGTGFSAAMTAANLMKLTSAAFSAFSVAMAEEFKKTMKSMADFKDFTKQKNEELEEAQKLLASTGYIYDPIHSSTGRNSEFYNLGESPDAFFARTIATGNIGTAVYAYLASYVDINLQLPSFQSTMNQLNQRAEMA